MRTGRLPTMEGTMLEDTSADTQAAAAAAATLHLRITIVGATVDLLRDVPFHEARPEQVAERLGIPVEELRQHFPSWDGLVLAALDRWNGSRMDEVAREVGDGSTVDLLRAIVASNTEEPALMRLLVALLSVAGNPVHPMSTYLRSRYTLFYSQVKRGLEHDVAVGRAPHTMDPRRGAEQLIALYEGLQLQAMLRSDLDLVPAFDRAVARLERGWMERYEPQAARRLSTWSGSGSWEI
ncbi:TetR/AcrR family transcriptional regulator [Curtobacterium sp. ISL-83]|uniref:TetR/AcrR family transcriptional regulator n=1 Tax=Curtobacterium sp. ISL-83 TaxID=2819145 RepID=UPI001BECD834|nr:TetR/AcrR family transcriptional regulator [Curtobacterium sp. ISL-83]MBT2502467.1 TetR/AcrR family transcriptional regulator [Curtobacterium sp. ISL-83]